MTTSTELKSERLDLRVAPTHLARIEEAAGVLRKRVSAFVLEAALAAADDLLARSQVTIMPREQFDELMASLDEPDTAPELKKLAELPRVSTRR